MILPLIQLNSSCQLCPEFPRLTWPDTSPAFAMSGVWEVAEDMSLHMLVNNM